MPQVHFLNVREGDCNVIQHYSGHVTVIDVCNASPVVTIPDIPIIMAPKVSLRSLLGAPPPLPGDFGQKDFPVNPIEYLKEQGINDAFRFILTHPDMDHMDGIKEFFKQFSPANLWDTDNNKAIDWSKKQHGRFNEADWKFYLSLRDGPKDRKNPTRLTLYSDSRNKYYNVGADGSDGGDGLHILAPTSDLVKDANVKREDYHGCSYVILYMTCNRRILFGGDSHDETWKHILANHKRDVTDVDVLIAPHHGRSSDRSYDFLDVVNPAFTLFGNAPSEHLAYSAFSSRKLPIITNNQAGSVLLNVDETSMSVYVTNKKFAQQRAAAYTFESPLHTGYHYLRDVRRTVKLKPPPTMPPIRTQW
jgi:beta-lactamase superfamily II metal-dependent hydrolase